MVIFGIFSTAFIVGFSGAMMPGPMLTVAINESSKNGFKAGPLLVLGHGILELLLVIGLVLGLGEILALPLVTGSIGLLGGLFLLWFGWTMTKDAYLGRVNLDETEKDSGKAKRLNPVAAGVMTSISNPYWILWWATIGASYLAFSLKYEVLGVSAFFSGHILADLAWYSLIAFATVTGKKFLSQRIYQAILIVCGLFLLGLGGYFIYSGFHFIF